MPAVLGCVQDTPGSSVRYILKLHRWRLDIHWHMSRLTSEPAILSDSHCIAAQRNQNKDRKVVALFSLFTFVFFFFLNGQTHN